MQFLNPFSFVDLVGQHCLARPMNCLGDSQDTDTYQISPPLTIDHGDVLAVMSTLATVTGNAVYVSLAVNRAAVLTGVANLSDEDLEGTAAKFCGTLPNTDQFYRYYLARDYRDRSLPRAAADGRAAGRDDQADPAELHRAGDAAGGGSGAGAGAAGGGASARAVSREP